MNIKDVAKLSGVSITTVSFVLNGKTNKVSEKTRQKVLKVMKEIGYEARGAARDLKSKKTKTIGVFFDFIYGPFISSFVAGMQQVIWKNGYDFFITDNYNVNIENGLSRFLLEKRVDGAVIFSTKTDEKKLDELSLTNLPIVMIDREVYKKNICSILTNSRIGILEAIEHIKKTGKNKIAFLSGLQEHYDNKERFAAFIEGVRKFNMQFSDNWFFEGDFSINSGYAAGQRLLEQKNRPEAVICSNDEMAFGLIQRLKENNIKIPDDISIVGFDDIEFSKFTSPKLTTIKGQTLSMGKLVAETIFRGIAGEEIEGVIKLPSKLIIRESA